jgi:glycosyltransferase involved in cell wall biosynthesis
MKILFLTRLYSPHIGGVEKHVQEVGLSLRKRGHRVTIISEEDIKYPHIKFLGLLTIWFWLLKNRSLIKQSDIVHCHDVFVWYLPFRFLYPKKPVYTTFHGWEGKYPIPWWNILQKRLAAKLSKGNICVGKYLEKWYGIKADKIIYGGVSRSPKLKTTKIPKTILWLGRLERDTGILEFLDWLSKHKKYTALFCGDGSLRKECEKYGKVYGFIDPKPFLQKTEICVPGGYLAYLEAKAAGCRIKTFANNPLKKDYWQEIQKLKIIPSWKEVAEIYENLYRCHRT